jgi:hypothetical protein
MREREIKRCVAVVHSPSGPGDHGEVTEGRYFIEGDWLTLCDEGGTALRSEDTGARFTVRLAPGDNEQTMAKRLTLRHHRAANRDEVAGWNRRISYGRNGYA